MARRRINLITALAWVIALSLSATRNSNADSALSPAALSVTAPGSADVAMPEIDEYATAVLGDPWDMNESTDLWYFRSESQMVNSQFNNGIYSAQMTTGQGGERITLITAGALNHAALRTGKIGYNYPIDADHYRWLTLRMYSSNTACNSGLIQWYSDDSYSNAALGVSNGFLVPPSPCLNLPAGWYTYVIDLKTIGIQLGTHNWTGTIRELLIHPFAGAGAAGATVKLDWARLTASDPRTARPFTVRWSNAAGSQVTLYANPDSTTYDANRTITIGTVSNTGSYTFQTGVLPAGKYYIGVKDSGGTIAWSTGALILNAPPQVVVTKPSMSSGQDFASTELGYPWDMSRPTAINYNLKSWETAAKCVTNESFSNGLYSAQVPPNCPPGNYSDPILFLGGLVGPSGTAYPSIDPGKYRYLTYRFFHSGQQNVGQGWITRLGWWADGSVSPSQPTVVSRDIIISEGWNTYKVDLWAPDVLDETYPPGTPAWLDSHPNRLRFDPDELAAFLAPATIQLDWIKLTAIDEVKQGDYFPIGYDVNATLPVTLIFYYDTDQNPANGSTQIGVKVLTSGTSAPNLAAWNNATPTPVRAASSLPYAVYLPLTVRNYPSCTGDCYAWNTASVSKGTYYVCINARDAYNATYRCSEAPLVIK